VIFKEKRVRLGFSLGKQKERKNEGLEERKGFRRKSKRKRQKLEVED
jgi:hypothetical protein